MTTPLSSALTGPAAAQGSPGSARRGTADSGDAFASLLGSVGEQGRDERVQRQRPLAPQQRWPQQRDSRDDGRRAEADHDGRGHDGGDRAVSRRRDDVVDARAERGALRRSAAEQAEKRARAARADERRTLQDQETEASVPSEGREATTSTEAGTATDDGATRSPEGAAPAVPQVAVVSPAQAIAGEPATATFPDVLGSTAGQLVVPEGAAEALAAGAEAAQAVPAAPAATAAPEPSTAVSMQPSLAVPAVESADAQAQVQLAGDGEPVDVTFLADAPLLPGEIPSATQAAATAVDGLVAPAVEVTKGAGASESDPATAVADPSAEVAAATPAAPSTTARQEAATAAAAPAPAAEATDATAPAEPLLRTNLGATVAELARSAQRDGSGATRVVIRLDPPELGTVTVALTVRGGDVRVNLLAAEVTAVAALDARRTDIDHALADAGLSLGSFDVHADSRQGQERQPDERGRAAASGRPWSALGPEMDWERAAAADRAARGVWL